ncbi:23S rRNA (Uracil-5-)-methyltransferase [gamma proteobacterium HdN1]|nr:23S rRNA (Uracil-5-)-methyltransferase [gamma proteobacterium HdN1]
MGHRKKRPLPTQPVELLVERFSDEGRGIGTLDGKIIFVDGALPGERVRFQYTYCSSKRDEGRVVEVLEPSPDRVEPPCPHANLCGGCSLQHMRPEAQIAFKQRILESHFVRNGKLVPSQWLEPLTGPALGYRRRARLGAKYVLKRETMMVGFREKRSSLIADLNQCETLVPEVGHAIQDLKILLGSLDAKGRIPQVQVAQGDDATALLFRHMDPLSEADQQALLGFCQQHGFQCYFQPGGENTVHRVWPSAGEERLCYRLPEFNIEMKFHPMDFTQVNPYINEKMVSRAVELLAPEPSERVLDLFCGLGNFTLPLARRADVVVGVEGSDALVQRGRENALHNGLQNVEFYGADLTKPLEHQAWAHDGFAKILIDPPRSGALELVQKITVFKPKRIVYVSCDPATLARDAAELARQGYRLVVAGVMDMFPHTTHVESIAVFEPVK